jgi:hypothetical protein
MEFLKAFRNIVNKQKRKAGTRAYYDRGEVYLSRIFGYKLEGGRYEPDPKYKPGIETIFHMLSAEMSLPDVKQSLDKMGAKDSSNNKYGMAKIMSLIRPIYSGYFEQRGKLVEIKNMTPIVSIDEYRRAAKQVKVERKKLIDQ